jgi:hypothetical protein
MSLLYKQSDMVLAFANARVWFGLLWLVIQMSQKAISARLVSELELARLAREPKLKNIFFYFFIF